MSIKLNVNNFKDEAMVSNKTVIIDFYAEWCGPCSMLSPVLEEIEKENENIKVCKVDIDEEEAIAEAFNIDVVPYLVVFKDGNLKKTIIGYREKDELLKLINE